MNKLLFGATALFLIIVILLWFIVYPAYLREQEQTTVLRPHAASAPPAPIDTAPVQPAGTATQRAPAPVPAQPGPQAHAPSWQPTADNWQPSGRTFDADQENLRRQFTAMPLAGMDETYARLEGLLAYATKYRNLEMRFDEAKTRASQDNSGATPAATPAAASAGGELARKVSAMQEQVAQLEEALAGVKQEQPAPASTSNTLDVAAYAQQVDAMAAELSQLSATLATIRSSVIVQQ